MAMEAGAARRPGRGGRPPRHKAAAIRDEILDHATALFFAQGYGATSIEAVARGAGMSKRTFYTRFKDKAELFHAVLHRVIEGLRAEDKPAISGETAAMLRQLALGILRASLTKQALALHRLLIAESGRFPELARVSSREGARAEAVERIAAILKQHPRGAGLSAEAALFAGEQLIQMLVSLPQRRALGLGKPLSVREQEQWADDTLRLFMGGCFGG